MARGEISAHVGKDERFTSIVTLATAGSAGYFAFGQGLQAELWVKWLITLAPAAVVLGLLLKYPHVARKLRVATGAVIGLAFLVLIIWGLVDLLS